MGDAPRPVRVDERRARACRVAVTLGGRRREVVAVRDDWLVQDLWWTDRPVDRHYFELVLDPGPGGGGLPRGGDGSWFAHSAGP